MKTLPTAVVLLLLCTAAAHVQAPIAAAEFRNVFPEDAKVEQFVVTSDGQRTYYTTTFGDVWLYDRAVNKGTRIVAGSVWDLAVSPTRDAVVFTKMGDLRQEQYVWMLPLDPNTGLAAGSERRVSAQSGDVPSISADGRWIAFARDDSTGVGQSIVIVPMRGGAERVVARDFPSSIGHIRWTPDGNTLYFGVNPPVPFTCAESCLSLPGGNPSVPGSIRRVAVTGGSVDVVATTGNPSPGLSPDGTRLVFGDRGGNRQFVVADRDGRTVSTFTLQSTQTAQGWSGDSTLLTLTSGNVRRLRAVSLDARSRTLFENPAFTLEPKWLPDGNAVSVMVGSGDRCELRIMNIDGSLRTGVALPQGCGSNPAWTADQHWFVYTRYPPNRPPVITAVDMATRQTRELHEGRAGGEPIWVLDSDRLIVSEMSDASEPPRRVLFWQVDLAGEHTLLRELPFEEPSGSVAVPLDGARVLVMRAGASPSVRLIRLSGQGGEQVLLPTRTGYVLPRPTISADSQWAAFRTNPSANDSTRLTRVELVRLDGSARQGIDLPFSVQGSQNSLALLPGAKQVILAERPSPNSAPGVYLVDVATQSTRRLFEYVPRGRPPELVASPDGATLLSLTTDMVTPSVSAMDLSRVR